MEGQTNLTRGAQRTSATPVTGIAGVGEWSPAGKELEIRANVHEKIRMGCLHVDVAEVRLVAASVGWTFAVEPTSNSLHEIKTLFPERSFQP